METLLSWLSLDDCLLPRKLIACYHKIDGHHFPDSETDWLVAECPEIGTASQGHTEDEALANLQEATDLYLESFPQTLKKPAVIRTFELAHG
jgi:predicted RNase H-like HicB family nuclease